MSIASIYNLEGEFESAIGLVFMQNGLIAYTSLGKIRSDGTPDPKMDLQKDRPRVEIVFTRGATKGHLHLVNDSDTYQQSIPDGYDASVSIALLTEPGLVHFNFLAIVRYLIPRLNQLVSLTNHKMYHPVREGAENHAYSSDKGYWVTFSKFDFAFSITRSAWADLSPLISQQ